jgi:hypothetical protein
LRRSFELEDVALYTGLTLLRSIVFKAESIVSKTKMAPSADLPDRTTDLPSAKDSRPRNEKPLKKSGALDTAFEYDELTPVIGREYPKANIVDDLLNGPDSDALLRDLAITSEYRPPFELT